MVAEIVPGQMKWAMVRDSNGDRNYKVTHRVNCEQTDGPGSALAAPGLPQVGEQWSFGDDVDAWAFCKLDATVTPHMEAANTQFLVEQLFSTKGDIQRCKDEQIEDPLLIPDRVSGTFVKYTEEATEDQFGRPLENSAHEQLRGPQVEFDAHRLTVTIEQNVINLQLPLLAQLANCVNESPLWGLAARCIKFMPVSFQKKYWGTCSVYYTRTLEFEINYATFDRLILDEGAKVIRGKWVKSSDTWKWVLDTAPVPDRNNPTDFIKALDFSGNPIKILLDGRGEPAKVIVSTSQYLNVFEGDGNTVGQPLYGNTAYWIAQVGGDDEWDAGVNYVVGNVVMRAGRLFACTIPSFNADPVGLGAGDWTEMPGGEIIDRGVWNSTATYFQGNRVDDPASKLNTGQIFVSKYPSADFTQLRIPTSI